MLRLETAGKPVVCVVAGHLCVCDSAEVLRYKMLTVQAANWACFVLNNNLTSIPLPICELTMLIGRGAGGKEGRHHFFNEMQEYRRRLLALHDLGLLRT